MGLYNTYNGYQSKAGTSSMEVYSLGDEVDLADGLYLASGAWLVIHEGRLLATYETATDKWGGEITLYDLAGIWDRNPIVRLIKEARGEEE